MINKDSLGCATSRNKGKTVCDNRKNIKVSTLEDHLLHSLKHHLMQPDHFEVFIDAFTEELSRLQREAAGDRNAIEARINKIAAQLDKAVNAILEGADALSLNAKMKTLEAEKITLEAQLSGISDEPAILLHPNMTYLYKEKVTSLSDAFKGNCEDRGAFEAIRALLDKVTLTPTDTGFDFDIQGELAAILSLSANNSQSAAGNTSVCSRTTKPSELAFEGSGELAQQVKLVAGACNHLDLRN